MRDRFAGCLIGQCLGDALGFPVEGCSADMCRTYVADCLVPAPVNATGRGSYPFGQYTDDSQLARELMESFASRRRFDPGDYAMRIAAIFKEDRIVGRGLATHAAAMRLEAGIPWQEAGAQPPDAGNGSAMRAAPIGLFFHDQPEALIRAAHDQGRSTHADPRCSAGAVAIAGCVAMALTRTDAPLDWLDPLADWVGAIDNEFAHHVRALREWVALPPDEAVLPISRCGLEPGYRDAWEHISPFVVGSVLWSLYSFVTNSGDYMATIRTAIGAGGDVDTTGAMAGALSGAYLGLDGIPNDAARRVTDRGTWEYSNLLELACTCHRITMEAAVRR